jgi:nucleotide-binding universal stress UspA family protein
MKLKLNKIMVPTDFSEASKQSLPYADALARKFSATVTLVYVVPAQAAAEFSRAGIVLEEKVALEKVTESLRQFRAKELSASLPVETLLREGVPYVEINNAAKELGTDLIILSTHGRTGLKHFFLGSTAERVAHRAPCPVLTIREEPLRIKFPGDSPCGFKRILVPIDFSQASHKALAYAAAFAEECGAEITLLHVVELPAYPEFGYVHVPMKEAEQKKTALETLQLAPIKLGEKARFVKSTLARVGNPSQEIIEEAMKQNSDLIVISTHGYSGLRHLLLGSTTEKVVRHAACPVLVVREQEHDCLGNPTEETALR